MTFSNSKDNSGKKVIEAELRFAVLTASSKNYSPGIARQAFSCYSFFFCDSSDGRKLSFCLHKSDMYVEFSCHTIS